MNNNWRAAFRKKKIFLSDPLQRARSTKQFVREAVAQLA